MKKFLLGTTAVALGMVTLASPVMAAAQEKFGANRRDTTPSLTFSGEGNFHGMFFKQKQRDIDPAVGADRAPGKGNGTHFEFADTRFNIAVDGKTQGYGEMDYGMLIGLNGDKNETNTIDEARVHLKGEWGTMTAGNTRGVEYTMSVGPLQDVMGGSGGPDGNYTHVVNRTTGVVVKMQPLGRSQDSTKINYYTPRIYGFQAGFSFTPNSRHFGERRLFTLTNTFDGANAIPFDKNHIAAGLNFKHKFHCGLDLAASAIGLWAGSTQQNRGRLAPIANNFLAPQNVGASGTANRQKTKSYLLGIVLGYGNFEGGFEFIDNMKSQELIGLSDNDAGRIYNFGLAYNIGPDKISAGYSHTTRRLGKNAAVPASVNLGRAKANVFSLAAERKLAPGLVFFAEGTYFKYDTNQQMNNANYAGAREWWAVSSSGSASEANFVDNNRGHVGMLGMRVKF